MRATLDIDVALMEGLLARMPGVTMTGAVERVLRAFLADDATARLRALAGTFEIEDVSHDLRRSGLGDEGRGASMLANVIVPWP